MHPTESSLDGGLKRLLCRLFGHQWRWCAVTWNTGKVVEEDRCRRCGQQLDAVA